MWYLAVQMPPKPVSRTKEINQQTYATHAKTLEMLFTKMNKKSAEI
jgi:hypothetical protein